MNQGVVIPLAVFALVVIIVALVHFTKIYDLEEDSRQRLGHEEVQHRRIMQELENELNRVKKMLTNGP